MGAMGGMGGPGGMAGPGGLGGEASGGYGGLGMPNKPVLDADGKEIPMDFAAERCDFIVQFAWRSRFEKGGGKDLDGGFPVVEVAAEPTDASTPDATTGDPATVPEQTQQ